jgi:uncharacterized membrane protein YhhN
MTPCVWLTSLAVAALLVCEQRGWRGGVWVAKPLASTGFLASALAAGALGSSYGRYVFVGLMLSWLGDVLLIPRERPKVFLLGVASFLLGHVAFAIAFLARGVSIAYALGASVASVAVLVVVARWLRPHLPDDMRAAAHAYMAVISVMVVAAAATFGAAPNGAILAGAIAFYVSDLSVARDRFVERAFVNRLWGLPLYYGAQLVLAYSTMAS